MVERVIATESTLALIDRLREKHGQMMFHQSGGCCEGSAANCMLPGELTIGQGDLLLGEIGGCKFYISKSQYVHWQHTQLIIDVVETRGGGYFSLEGPEGVSFHTRSRIFSQEELAELASTSLQ